MDVCRFINSKDAAKRLEALGWQCPEEYFHDSAWRAMHGEANGAE